MHDLQHILDENNRRIATRFGPYDPITGLNSPIDRFPFKVLKRQKKDHYIPNSMLADNQICAVVESGLSLEEYCEVRNKDFEQAKIRFHQLRWDHDFEFWAFTCVKIKPKEGGEVFPFKLRYAQRKLLKELEDDRIKHVKTRITLLKARQWGGSTLVQIYMLWVQMRHKKRWNSLIAAHINQAAANIRGMVQTVFDNYPLEPVDFKPFEGQTNVKILKNNRDCKITIGSMQTPNSIRSDDAAMAHLSEVAYWKHTEGKKPEDLIQSITGTVPSLPYSMIILESTAKGVGNYFHQSYLNAKKGNGQKAVFVAWWEIDMYQETFYTDRERIEFYQSFHGRSEPNFEYEQYLWDIGATLEGIKWYRSMLQQFHGNKDSMSSEFPSDDQEAFSSSGSRYFAPSVVKKARSFNTDPILQGEIFADGYKGKEALQNIRIEPSDNGNLWVWAMPEKHEDYPAKKYVNRYLVTLDIGGRTKKADDSVIKVYDRYWLLHNGSLEPAAVWAGKIDFDLLAWKAIQICKLYDNAFFIPEINKMREHDSKEEFDEGSQFYTIVDEIAEFYDNIFCRTNPEQIAEGKPRSYGFHMNVQTKPMILSAMNAAWRDGSMIEFDSRACDQADSFENKGNGKTGAVTGAHDDHVIVTGLGAWGGLHHMEPIYEQTSEEKEKIKSKPPQNQYSF